jgi:hypothetical protein
VVAFAADVASGGGDTADEFDSDDFDIVEFATLLLGDGGDDDDDGADKNVNKLSTVQLSIPFPFAFAILPPTALPAFPPFGRFAFGFGFGFAFAFAIGLGFAIDFAFGMGFAFAFGLAIAFAFAFAIAFAFAFGMGFAFAIKVGAATISNGAASTCRCSASVATARQLPRSKSSGSENPPVCASAESMRRMPARREKPIKHKDKNTIKITRSTTNATKNHAIRKNQAEKRECQN